MDTTFDWMDDSESIVMSDYRVFVPCKDCRRSVIINTTCECQKKDNAYYMHAYVLAGSALISCIITMMVML